MSLSLSAVAASRPTLTVSSGSTSSAPIADMIRVDPYTNSTDYYTVYFSSTGSTHIGSQIVEHSTWAAMPINPNRTGYAVLNCYSNISLINSWDFDANTISAITPLRASWQIIPPIQVEDDLDSWIDNESNLIESNECNEMFVYGEDADGKYGEYIDNTKWGIIEFILHSFDNPINDNIRNYQIVNISSLGLQFLYGNIPAFTNGDGLFYNIRYRTNIGSRGTIVSNIPSDRPFTFLSPELSSNELITEIIIEFDYIPSGFGVGDIITYRFAVLDVNNVANRWEVMFGEASNRDAIIFAILNNIDRVSSLQGRNNTEPWINFQVVISAVQTIIADPSSTIEELELAYITLQQAIGDLNPITTPFPPLNIAIATFVLAIALVLILIKLLRYKKQYLVSLSD